MTQHLTINGVDICQNFHVVCDEKQAYKKPERNVSTTLVNGRNGEILTDYKSMKNVEIVYTCVISENFRRNYNALMDYLYSLEGYVEIIDDNDGDCYRQGYFVGNTDVDQITQDGGRFSITLNCKPQRFLTEGKKEIIYGSSDTALYINSNFPAEIIENADVVANSSGKYALIKSQLQSYVDSGCDFLQVKVLRSIGATVTVKIDNSDSDYKALYCSANRNEAESSFSVIKLTTTQTSSATNTSAYYAEYYPYWWIFIPILGSDVVDVDGVLVYRNTEYIHKTLFNPTLQIAKPLIKIDFENATVRDGLVLMKVNGIEVIRGSGLSDSPSIMIEPIYIDTETCAIYEIYNNVYYNAAMEIEFMPIIPELKTGINTIDYHKNFSVSIIPRWWRI